MKFKQLIAGDPWLKRLGKIAIVGAAVTLSTGLYFEWKIRKRIIDAPYYQQALRLLHQNTDVISYLGPPIGIGKINLGNRNNFGKDNQAQFQVPITGNNHDGEMHFWAHKDLAAVDWIVDRVEVSLKNTPGKRILVHKTKEQQQQSVDSDHQRQQE